MKVVSKNEERRMQCIRLKGEQEQLVNVHLLVAILNPYHSGSEPNHLVPIFVRLQHKTIRNVISEVGNMEVRRKTQSGDRRRGCRGCRSIRGRQEYQGEAGDSGRDSPVFPVVPC